jgi:hypothetical protein
MERLNTSPMAIACKTLFCENRGGAEIPKFKNLKEFKLKLKHQNSAPASTFQKIKGEEWLYSAK